MKLESKDEVFNAQTRGDEARPHQRGGGVEVWGGEANYVCVAARRWLRGSLRRWGRLRTTVVRGGDARNEELEEAIIIVGGRETMAG
jgi:hypothetical protein